MTYLNFHFREIRLKVFFSRRLHRRLYYNNVTLQRNSSVNVNSRIVKLSINLPTVFRINWPLFFWQQVT